MKISDLSHLVAALLVVIALNGCSQRHPPASDAAWLPESGDIVRAEVTAGGLHATYTAHFDHERLQRITEVRNSGTTPETGNKGEYVFQEARLIQYKGAALGSGASIELTFDMHGALVSANPEVDAREIGAIRTRAALLRSLALTRRSTESHSG
ncbi:MAG TPA: hypothetical protein VKB34_22040 [Povalibacter sp.]|nr:hypothetical protein [Povalibacter sp.]